MRLNHLSLALSLFLSKFNVRVCVYAATLMHLSKYENLNIKKYESKSRNKNAPNVLNIRLLLLFDVLSLTYEIYSFYLYTYVCTFVFALIFN